VSSQIHIQLAGPNQVPEIAPMVGALLTEIMQRVGADAFRFNSEETSTRLNDALERGIYHVFLARAGERAIGFIALYESFALYAEGAFGTIPEFYVAPEYRSEGVGLRLLERVKAYGRERGWKRLEVTTPPLPVFDRTLDFYRREGFEVAGGRKMKIEL
jgi:GNAT superfamily N-acetyltransferase